MFYIQWHSGSKPTTSALARAGETAAFGLRMNSALIVAALFNEGKTPVRPSVLAEVLELPRSPISQALKDLEERGWIVRQLVPDDARGFELRLTPTGRRRAAQVVSWLDRLQNRLENQYSETQLKALTTNLRRVEAGYLP